MVGRTSSEQTDRSCFPSSSDWAEIGRNATFSEQKTHRRGETLFREGDCATHLVHIREGLVKLVIYSRQGKDVIVEICGPGSTLGETSLPDGEPYDVTAICISPAATLWESLATLCSKSARESEILRDVVRSLSARLQATRANVCNLAVERVNARIAALLVKFAENPIDPTIPLPVIPLTRQEIADTVGATVETTIRTLSSFVQEGAVERRNRGLVVMDVEYLKAFTRGDVPQPGGRYGRA